MTESSHLFFYFIIFFSKFAEFVSLHYKVNNIKVNMTKINGFNTLEPLPAHPFINPSVLDPFLW